MKLAVDGGKPVFEQPAKLPECPSVYQETLGQLKEDTLLCAENTGFIRKHPGAIPGIRVRAPEKKAAVQSYYNFCLNVMTAYSR